MRKELIIMNKAIQLNHCARHTNVEKIKKRIEYTEEWIETVLFPALEKAAADGLYTYSLHKVKYANDIIAFDGLVRSEQGLAISLIVATLKEKGFYIENEGSVYTISWEDKYVY